MAQLALSDPMSVEPASRTIVIAVAANTIFKTGMVAFLGAAGLRRLILAAAGAILAVGTIAALLI
jgi:uncharacterized membrane protein (DUF4010 family)